MNLAPPARRTHYRGPSAPKRVTPLPSLAEKNWGRHPEIAELQPSTLVAEIKGATKGDDLGSWDSSKIWDFGLNKGYWVFYCIFKVFKDISLILCLKIIIFFQKIENFSKILAPAAPQFGIFPIFFAPPKNWDLSQKVTPPVDPWMKLSRYRE